MYSFVFLSLVIIAVAQAVLRLNETFENLDRWLLHADGHTAVVKTVNGTSNEYVNPSPNPIPAVTNRLFTNISYCGSGYCYRAEAAMQYALRPIIVPNCTLEYWLGFSIYLPTSWHYSPSPDNLQDVAYHFQIHGGDNEGGSPILGVRQVKDRLMINVCGNDGPGKAVICAYYDMGALAQGQWIDIVIHSQLAFGEPTGWIQAWRNNVLMLNASNLLTSYDEVKPPYLIAGSYQFNWKENQTVGYDWVACFHKAVRLGLSDSSYDEVYTGDGAPCGIYCSSAEKRAHEISNMFDENFLWGIIPMFLIVFFSMILYAASASYRKKTWELPNNVDLVSEKDDDLEKQLSFSPMSYRRFLNGVDPFAVKQQVEDNLKQWRRFKASFRNQSLTRTIFWYGFAVVWCLFLLGISMVLYGAPHYQDLPFRFFDGLIPVKSLTQWSTLQSTMIAISGTMVCIYFYPLSYLRHDFEAGRQWKNDPNFLHKIGVIIPCHKSANEIGEVLRRALIYFPPENIVVCDNGNFDYPPDNTFEVVKAQHRKIRYIYIKQGHKTRALWTGVHRLPAHVEYIVHLDDDTHFDEHHMVFDEKHFEEKHVIAVAFLRSSYQTNVVTQYTDFWYKITDHFHATQAKIATRCFVPGPAGLWRRDKFMEIFGQHPSLPFGEDIFGGFTTLNNGYAIRSETRCMVKTFAPDTLFPPWIGTGRVQGYGASSLWKQRAHRWTVSALRITGKSLYSFFTYDSKLGIFSNIAFRLYRLREYKLILAQLCFIPFCLIIFARGFYYEYAFLKFLLFIVPLLRNIYINYVCWRGQPELQVPLKTVLLSPFFNFFLICCAIHGRWKCILWYLPCVSPNHGMLRRCRPRPLRKVPIDADLELVNFSDLPKISSDDSSSSINGIDINDSLDLEENSFAQREQLDDIYRSNRVEGSVDLQSNPMNIGKTDEFSSSKRQNILRSLLSRFLSYFSSSVDHGMKSDSGSTSQTDFPSLKRTELVRTVSNESFSTSIDVGYQLFPEENSFFQDLKTPSAIKYDRQVTTVDRSHILEENLEKKDVVSAMANSEGNMFDDERLFELFDREGGLSRFVRYRPKSQLEQVMNPQEEERSESYFLAIEAAKRKDYAYFNDSLEIEIPEHHYQSYLGEVRL